MTDAATPLAFPTVDPALAVSLDAGMVAVEAFIAERVDGDDPFIAEGSGHLYRAGGKRFRPLLTLLAAHLGDGVNERVIAAAAAVELTHLASLYHDDVMDEASLRRGAASANARYGNSTAILIGDLLFGTASSIVADLGAEAVKVQAATFVRLCAGQIRDARPRPPGVDPIAYYLAVLQDKTGALIATSARYGAMFSGCDGATVELAHTYGERIGVAFQLADDLLDIASSGEQSGKTPGTDLREGVDTLPVLYVKADPSPEDPRLLELLGSDLRSDPAAHAEALKRLRQHSAMARAAEHTRDVARQAQRVLEPLGQTPAVRSLSWLAGSVVDRVV
ncbi:MAG TPA: polyprenyl synthetase family protein [Dermatophilaceae bacterium]|nr:polyprenyl synthetase family protein [Dermatophilaceae bacterium]